jgi:vancomycin resistance protein YoaR
MCKITRTILTAVLCLLAIVFAGSAAYASYSVLFNHKPYLPEAGDSAKEEFLSKSVFRDGTFINGIPVGGMTMDEAKSALRLVRNSMRRGVSYKVKYDDKTLIKLGWDYFNFNFNTDLILEKAMLNGTDKNLEYIPGEVKKLALECKDYELMCRIAIKKDMVKADVKEAAKSIERDPVNATWIVNADNVYSGGSPIDYVKGQNGIKANTDSLLKEIFSMFSEGKYGNVKLTTSKIEPEIKLSDIKDTIVKRASYKSSYSHGQYSAPNRVANIIKACGIVNGTVLAPGKVFSANETLGPRTLEGGWLPAPGFVDGGASSVDSPGGGVCHVSSTLYNAVIKSDLKIVYRINHSSHVGYVPWGLDATIDSRGPDFKFKNNTGYDLFIFTWVDERKQTVNCEIWGEPFPDSFDKIDFYAELTEEIPPTETEYITDKSLATGYWYVKNVAKTGYKYQSYKQYYKNGEAVSEPIPVASSYYRMHPLRICVWKGFQPGVDHLDPDHEIIIEEPEPSPSPSPDPNS